MIAIDIGLLFAFVVVASVLMTRGMMALAQNRGWVVPPKADRWSKTPTALYGGVAIVTAFTAGAIVAMLRMGTPKHSDLIGLFAGAAVLFAVGLRDDARALRHQS